MYAIINNQVRKAERLTPEELAGATRYPDAATAENALLEQRAARGDWKARRELRERAKFAKWLKKRDALVDEIIMECSRLGEEPPAAARALGSYDLEELAAVLDRLKARE